MTPDALLRRSWRPAGRGLATRRSGSLVAVLLLVALAAGTGTSSVAAPEQLSPSSSESSLSAELAPISSAGKLPFDMQSAAALRATGRLVFAHYWPPLPVSLDNEPSTSDYYARNYLNPDGESGKHAAYGGHLRDRPVTRDPLTDSDWRVVDKTTEVRQAIAAGLDGFALDIMQIEGDPDRAVWESAQHLLQAAQAVDPAFEVMLMPDMSGSMRTKSPGSLAASMARLGASPSAFRLADGRLVISPFMAEAHSSAWWQEFLTIMRTTHATPVAFVPVFVGDEQVLAPLYDSISHGMGNWGARNPTWNDAEATYSTGPVGRAEKVHALGQLWMQPVSVQDARPNQGVFDEAGNTTNLRNTWKIARDGKAEWVQLPTWNDYTESAHVVPSVKHGWTFLDIHSYYLTWFKTGTPPKIVRDAVYVTHRTQPWQAKPRYPQTKLMTLRGGTPARDTVEALTFLTAPGVVTLTVGGRSTSCQAPAGPGTCTASLVPGTVQAVVTRSGATVASVTSPYAVTATPYVQDLQYVGASSLRSSTVSPPLPPPTTPTVQTLAPVADTYANQGAPSTNFGTTSSLSSRGSIGAVSYLLFALPAAPVGKTLTGAALRIRTTHDSFAGSAGTHPVRLAADTWSELVLNWANRPSPGTTVLGSVPATAPSTAYQVALSPSALRGLAGTTATLSVSNAGTDNLWFWSRHHATAAYQPRLVLTYS